MRRRLIVAALFLLAGAVVNVAVAWAFNVFGAGPRWMWIVPASRSATEEERAI